MNKPLFALQSDLDMVAIQVQTLSLSLNKLDWIIQSIKRLDEELACQGEQMRRMETKISAMETKISAMETKISAMETKISALEKNIGKIMAHLKIK